MVGGTVAVSNVVIDDEPPEETTISWGTTVMSLRGSDETHSFVCPPDGSSNTVWGDEIYTDDSSVCTAAVHAGLISFEDGGDVELSILGGLESYAASERNGVSTHSWPSWGGSFAFVEE